MAEVELRFKIPEGLKAELDEAAHDRLLSPAKLAELAVRDFLGRLVPVDELQLTREPRHDG